MRSNLHVCEYIVVLCYAGETVDRKRNNCELSHFVHCSSNPDSPTMSLCVIRAAVITSIILIFLLTYQFSRI